MADSNIEILRAIVAKADSHDADVAKLNAEIARLTKLVKPTPAPTPTPTPTPTPASPNVTLRGRKIYRANGKEIIARGPELTVADYPAALDHVDAIGKTGANACRMLLTLTKGSHMTPARFDEILTRAASYGMVVWVSFYVWDDGTNWEIAPELGGGNFYQLGGGSEVEPAKCYLEVWSRQWAKDLMHKHRNHVIIDAAQEYKAPSRGTDAERQNAWALSAEHGIRHLRAQGYTQPLEIMSNAEGRDLAAIIRHGERIRQVDTVRVDGQPQTMFGWQAYWNTSDNPTWYPGWQGEMLLGKGKSITAVGAMEQFVAKAAFPIQMGFDNIDSDTNRNWKVQMDAAATLGLSWLWWSWDREHGTVEARVDGAAAQAYVINSAAGFKGASKT